MIEPQFNGYLLVQNYGLHEFLKEVEIAIKEGFELDLTNGEFGKNETFPHTFGSMHTVLLRPQSKSTEQFIEDITEENIRLDDDSEEKDNQNEEKVVENNSSEENSTENNQIVENSPSDNASVDNTVKSETAPKKRGPKSNQ